MPAKSSPRPCAVDDCPNLCHGLGWCAAHYQAWLKTGDPLTYQGPRKRGTCKINGCERPHYTHGFCRGHGNAFKRTGDPLNYLKPKAPKPLCSVDSCEAEAKLRGFCRPHHGAWQRTGDPLSLGKSRPLQDLAERVWQYVDRRGPDECWPWVGKPGVGGYGRLHMPGNRGATASRVVYELENGPVPDGLHVDHTCHNRDDSCPGADDCVHRLCCNPSHLEAVTPRENALRSRHTLTGINAPKTHCPRGHAYEGTNLYVVPKTRHRQCRACRSLREAARRR
jgi:hypothetical protein